MNIVPKCTKKPKKKMSQSTNTTKPDQITIPIREANDIIKMTTTATANSQRS